MRAQARLDAGAHVGVHAVADHRGPLRVGTDFVQASADHDRVRLAHEVGLLAGGRRDHRGDCAARGQGALVGRTGYVGVRRNELRAALNEANRMGQGVKIVVANLAEHHELRIRFRHDIAGGVNRGRQASFANHVGR